MNNIWTGNIQYIHAIVYTSIVITLKNLQLENYIILLNLFVFKQVLTTIFSLNYVLKVHPTLPDTAIFTHINVNNLVVIEFILICICWNAVLWILCSINPAKWLFSPR